MQEREAQNVQRLIPLYSAGFQTTTYIKDHAACHSVLHVTELEETKRNGIKGLDLNEKWKSVSGEA